MEGACQQWCVGRVGNPILRISFCGSFCLQNDLNLNNVFACLTYSRPERAQEPVYQIDNVLFLAL